MFDVAIVGAGPGGAAAAVALGQLGIKNVALLDREGFPRDKTCGSGLSPNALVLVKKLGIADDVHRLGHAINTVRVVTRGGRELKISSNAAAVVLLRRHFDHLLVQRAQSLGVSLKTPFRADSIIEEDGRVVGVRSFEGEEVRAKVVLFADGAHSIFSVDRRPKRSISTLMGWWENFPSDQHTLDMIFDADVAPLYGWMFPETDERVNIGICIDGQDDDGNKSTKNLRKTFEGFLERHYGDKLKSAKQLGGWKGHPIVYTTWIGEMTRPGALYLGEAARITHNATGEGISQAMESGVFAAEAAAAVLQGKRSERWAWNEYVMRHRKRFTASFLAGHTLRTVIDSPMLDGVADVYNNAMVRKVVTKVLGSALAGSSVKSA
jgi:geranylgeranyl reductase family protein